MYHYVFCGYVAYKVYEYFDLITIPISIGKTLFKYFASKRIEYEDTNMDWIYIEKDNDIHLLVSS